MTASSRRPGQPQCARSTHLQHPSVRPPFGIHGGGTFKRCASPRHLSITKRGRCRVRFPLVATICMFVLAITAVTASALTPSQIGKCLDLSGRTSLRLASVDDGLGLTREQILEAKQRVSDFWRGRATSWTIDDLGFTPAQAASFTSRVNAKIKQSSWPLGSPCAPFKRRSKVVAEVRALLIYNGYRPSMKFSFPSPRQISVDAIKDGYRMLVTVVKIAPRKIMVSSQPIPSSAGGGGSVTVPLKFDA